MPEVAREVWPHALNNIAEGGSLPAQDPTTRARAYLVETARPGDTMMRQGPELAIGRLHPEFVLRLASAIEEVRQRGLTSAGIFSAYRPPIFGVGGFSDKFNSLHSYGLAVDMYGIGMPGSAEAKLWHETAAKHGIVCPYGYQSRKEWNHCQPTPLKIVGQQEPLRNMITAAGPRSLEQMFEVGEAYIASLDEAAQAPVIAASTPALTPAAIEAADNVARRPRSSSPDADAGRTRHGPEPGLRRSARLSASQPSKLADLGRTPGQGGPRVVSVEEGRAFLRQRSSGHLAHFAGIATKK
jgi:hypothetical protein